MATIFIRQREPQNHIIPTCYEPCAGGLSFNRDLLYVRREASQSLLGMGNSKEGSAMLIPIDGRLLGRGLAWGKRTFAFAKRIATLEARVAALEEALAKQPPEACPFCGERAMRKTFAGPAIGGATSASRLDRWKCEKCGEEEPRMVYFSAADR
jgi:hypothetical protein